MKSKAEVPSVRVKANGKACTRESQVEGKLRKYGEKHKLGDAKKTLEILYIGRDMSLDEIASEIKVSRPSVAYAARQMGFDILRRGRANLMVKMVKRAGHSSVAAYFQAKDKSAPTPFEDMAKELKVCTATIEKHYALYLKAISEKNKVDKNNV